MDARPGTRQGNELELLAAPIEIYEAEWRRSRRPAPLKPSAFAWNRRVCDPKIWFRSGQPEPRVGSTQRTEAVDTENDPSSARGTGNPVEILLGESEAVSGKA